MNETSRADAVAGKLAGLRNGNSPEAGARAFNAANAAFRKGKWAEALHWSEAARAADVRLTAAVVLEARCFDRLGRLSEAQAAYVDAVEIDPTSFSGWLEFGNVCRRLGQVDRAIECYQRAIACRPDDPRGYLAAARAFEETGTTQGVDCGAFHYHRACSCVAWAAETAVMTEADIHRQMAGFRLARGDAGRALEAFRQALVVARPEAPQASVGDLAEIRLGLAEALLRLGLTDEAHHEMEQVSRSENEALLSRLAELAYRFNLWPEAVDVLQRNLELHPGSFTARLNLANMLARSWQLEKALTVLDNVDEGEISGKSEGARVTTLRGMIATRMGQPDRARHLYQQLVDAGSDALRSSIAMSALYSDSLSPKEVANLHRTLFAPLGEGARPVSSFGNDRSCNRPLRIGMVTADLHHQHPVNLFLQPMLAAWDHDSLPLTIYFTGHTHDSQTRLAKSRVKAWRECTHAELARKVEEDRIDILIDLAGHTSFTSMAQFACRLAPVQATFLGYPSSTGVPNIDWIFADPVVAPPEHDHLFSERVARLPHAVFCYAPEEAYPAPALDDDRISRQLTFGSFNNVVKLTPRTIRLWVKVLLALPEARLLLKAPSFDDAGAVDRFGKLFAEQGIPGDRLEFRGPIGLREMMAEYADVDIGLDTVPYNGGTTTHQALWMGVPVIVLEGGNFASRMGASFMHAAGLSDWVASDDEGYVDIARRMAADRRGLLALKRGLRNRLRSRPGWEIEPYIESFQARLREMWPPAEASG